MTLHERTADCGTFNVAIEYDFPTEALTVEVSDKYGAWTLHPVDGKQAIDMFYHPYAYTPAYIVEQRRVPVMESA